MQQTLIDDVINDKEGVRWFKSQNKAHVQGLQNADHRCLATTKPVYWIRAQEHAVWWHLHLHIATTSTAKYKGHQYKILNNNSVL